jgi:hypothetical protein
MPFKKANTEERASLTVRIVHLFWLAVSKRNKFCDGALLNEMTDCAFFIFLLDCFTIHSRLLRLDKGCQIFLSATYQNGKNIPNDHKMYQ